MSKYLLPQSTTTPVNPFVNNTEHSPHVSILQMARGKASHEAAAHRSVQHSTCEALLAQTRAGIIWMTGSAGFLGEKLFY